MAFVAEYIGGPKDGQCEKFDDDQKHKVIVKRKGKKTGTPYLHTYLTDRTTGGFRKLIWKGKTACS